MEIPGAYRIPGLSTKLLAFARSAGPDLSDNRVRLSRNTSYSIMRRPYIGLTAYVVVLHAVPSKENEGPLFVAASNQIKGQRMRAFDRSDRVISRICGTAHYRLQIRGRQRAVAATETK